MKRLWKRIFAGALSCALALSLSAGLACMPASAAGNNGPQPVYQGDGYYITVELYGNQDLDLNLSTPFSDGLIRFGDLSGYEFADKDGNVVIPAVSQDDRGYSIDIIAGYFSDGLCLVRGSTDDGYPAYGYIDKSGQVAIPLVYRDAQPFVNGAAAVATVGSDRVEDWNFIDISGNFILTEVGGSMYASNDPSPLSEDRFFQFRDNWKLTDDDGQYGLFNGEGQLLTTITRQDLGGEDMNYMYPSGGYSEGYLVLATASDYTEDGLDCAVIDKDGNLVWAGYDYRVYYGNDSLCYDAGVHSGLLVVRHNASSLSSGSAVVNVETGEFLPLPEENLTLRDDFRDGLATASRSGSGFCVVDAQGNDVIPLGELGRYSRISPFNEGLAIAEIDDQYYLLEKHEGTYTGQLPQEEQPTYEQGNVPDNSLLEASSPSTGSVTVTDYEGIARTVYQYPEGTSFSVRRDAQSSGGPSSYLSYVYDITTGGNVASPYDAWTLPSSGYYRLGVYDVSLGQITYAYITAEGAGQTQPEQPTTVAGFTDVSASAWYAGYVETVVDKGLFSGKGEGVFGPEDSMTYAEFLVVLSQFSGESIPGAAGAWYQGYVNWAENAGLIPAGMGSFNPDAPITRQDMAALFGTFLGTYDHDSSTVNSGDAAFADEGSIADYAADGVQTCYELGIMSGKDGNAFDPLGTATRAEVAVTMVQMARVMGK